MYAKVLSTAFMVCAAAVLPLGTVGCSQTPATAEQHAVPAERERFATPDAAFQALVAALRSNDQARLTKILAPSGDDILSSGDEVADRADLERFLSLYDDAHRLETIGAGVTNLLVGRDGWPFPVPVVKAGDAYAFDVETGEEEIANRRVGRNELTTLQVCLAIVDAQRDYVTLNPTGSDLPVYARKVFSDPGQKNGLYWPTKDDEPASPLGPLVAVAADEGYGKPATQPAGEEKPPYHGYRYRLHTAQGPNAPGGATDYVVDGKLIGGFAVVAYPAQYGNSGIMTFITNHDGTVFQRDLGPDTQKIASTMTAFDPGPEWAQCADPSQPAVKPD